MCSVPAEFGQYLAVCLVYSGDVVQKEVISAVSHVKELGLASFVDWSPGFKIGINHKVPIFHPDLEINGSELSLGSVANSTAAGRYWSDINHRYDLMFDKAAFLHWFFIEGMEEQDFHQARETTAAIENEYLELKTSTPKM
uniref:Tubulin/FtsZ 2-layer sandwich domain-containing protein n=1 Tax=Lygus hesperus TaxID=30085 RepID=A0A0A9X904_LYGHE